MRRLALWTILAAVLAAGPVFADEPKLSPLPPPAATKDEAPPTREAPATPVAPAPAEQSLDEAMKANATCQAFTNECEICTRAAAGPQCSTPGPVCQPKAWRCDNR